MSIVETSTDVDYKSPEELVAFLRTNPPKAKGQFAVADGRCCLGHYADLCGIEYSPSAGGFCTVRSDTDPVAPPSLWLFDPATAVSGPAVTLVVTTSHQANLVRLNDANDTFAEVIDYLENVVIGGRA